MNIQFRNNPFVLRFQQDGLDGVNALMAEQEHHYLFPYDKQFNHEHDHACLWAAKEGNGALLSLLSNRRNDMDAFHKCIGVAAQYNQTHLLEYLLKRTHDVVRHGKSWLGAAAQNGHIEACMILIDKLEQHYHTYDIVLKSLGAAAEHPSWDVSERILQRITDKRQNDSQSVLKVRNNELIHQGIICAQQACARGNALIVEQWALVIEHAFENETPKRTNNERQRLCASFYVHAFKGACQAKTPDTIHFLMEHVLEKNIEEHLFYAGLADLVLHYIKCDNRQKVQPLAQILPKDKLLKNSLKPKNVERIDAMYAEHEANIIREHLREEVGDVGVERMRKKM